VERLVREIVSAKLHVRPNCAARTVLADIRPIVEIAQRTGRQLEVAAFIGSSPLRHYAESWTLDFLERSTAEALSFAVKEGLTVFFVTEDTLRADPTSLRLLYTTAVRAGASRICVADTVGHATPHGARAVVQFALRLLRELETDDVGVDWHGHDDRGLAVANSIAACQAGATRLHGTGLGVGERTGNAPMDLLLVNLALLGYRPADLTKLPSRTRRAFRSRRSTRLSDAMPSGRPRGCTRPPLRRRGARGMLLPSTRCIRECLPRSWGGSRKSTSARSPASGT
jgi:2-isopropylmalate synthase